MGLVFVLVLNCLREISDNFICYIKDDYIRSIENLYSPAALLEVPIHLPAWGTM